MVSKWSSMNNEHTKTHSLCCQNKTECQLQADKSWSKQNSDVFTLVLPFSVKTCCSTLMCDSTYDTAKHQNKTKQRYDLKIILWKCF